MEGRKGRQGMAGQGRPVRLRKTVEQSRSSPKYRDTQVPRYTCGWLRAGWLHLLPKSRSGQKIQPDNAQGKKDLQPGPDPTTLEPSSLSLLPHVYNAARGNNSQHTGQAAGRRTGGSTPCEGRCVKERGETLVSVRVSCELLPLQSWLRLPYLLPPSLPPASCFLSPASQTQIDSARD